MLVFRFGLATLEVGRFWAQLRRVLLPFGAVPLLDTKTKQWPSKIVERDIRIGFAEKDLLHYLVMFGHRMFFALFHRLTIVINRNRKSI
jgi:hypothetical protein